MLKLVGPTNSSRYRTSQPRNAPQPTLTRDAASRKTKKESLEAKRHNRRETNLNVERMRSRARYKLDYAWWALRDPLPYTVATPPELVLYTDKLAGWLTCSCFCLSLSLPLLQNCKIVVRSVECCIVLVCPLCSL